MKPHRNFRFSGKREMFAVVGFRYDQPSSIEYLQRKAPGSISAAVLRLLKDKGADVVSIRRVYLGKEPEPEPGGLLPTLLEAEPSDMTSDGS